MYIEAEPRTSWSQSDVGPRSSLVELVDRANGGDAEAWNEIVDRFSAMVSSIARRYRLSAADVADVSQTTWMRLAEHLDRIENPERIGAWLATTARRESLRTLRLRDRNVPVPGDEFADLSCSDAHAGVDTAILTNERDRELRWLVAALPARDQVLLHLLTEDSTVSYLKIGKVLRMPTGSIGPTRARCLERLRRVAATRGITLEPA